MGSEGDFHGVKQLLPPSEEASHLADVICGQGNIGTVVKANPDDPHVIAFVTVINMKQYDLSAVRKFLIKRAKKCGEEMLAKWKGVLGGAKHHVGFLFNERMQNLPEEVAPALHKAVKEDIEWSTTAKEIPKDERKFYNFTHVVGVADFTAGKKGKRDFLRFEDERLVARSLPDMQVVFKEQRRYSTHRMIYALTKEQYDEAVEEMEAPEL